MAVALPTREVIVCSKVALGYPLDLGGKVLEADLIVFNLIGFDIIMGMDWLFRHYTSINCQSQVVNFQLPKEE